MRQWRRPTAPARQRRPTTEVDDQFGGVSRNAAYETEAFLFRIKRVSYYTPGVASAVAEQREASGVWGPDPPLTTSKQRAPFGAEGTRPAVADRIQNRISSVAIRQLIPAQGSYSFGVNTPSRWSACSAGYCSVRFSPLLDQHVRCVLNASWVGLTGSRVCCFGGPPAGFA